MNVNRKIGSYEYQVQRAPSTIRRWGIEGGEGGRVKVAPSRTSMYMQRFGHRSAVYGTQRVAGSCCFSRSSALPYIGAKWLSRLEMRFFSEAACPESRAGLDAWVIKSFFGCDICRQTILRVRACVRVCVFFLFVITGHFQISSGAARVH